MSKHLAYGKAVKAVGKQVKKTPLYSGDTKDIDTSVQATKKTARQSKNIDDARSPKKNAQRSAESELYTSRWFDNPQKSRVTTKTPVKDQYKRRTKNSLDIEDNANDELDYINNQYGVGRAAGLVTTNHQLAKESAKPQKSFKKVKSVQPSGTKFFKHTIKDN